MDFKDKAKAAAKNIEGKVQEAAGHVTGDPQDKIRGRAKQDEAAESYARRDAKQNVTPGQISTPGATPAQSGYSTSDRDPYNHPQDATPGQAPMPRSTPDQTGYDVSERDNYPQDVVSGQAPMSGTAPAQPNNPTSNRNPYNYPQDVTPGQAPMPGSTPDQPGYGVSDRDDVARDKVDRS